MVLAKISFLSMVLVYQFLLEIIVFKEILNIYMFLGLSDYRRIKRWAEKEHSFAQSPLWFKMVPLIKVDSLPTKKKGQSDTIYVYEYVYTYCLQYV